MAERLKTLTDLCGDAVELVWRPAMPIGVDAEAISGKAREHVNVGVEDLLERRGAISQEQVDPLAAKATSVEGSRQKMCDAEDVRTQVRLQVVEAGDMHFGDDECMPGRDGLTVQESEDQIVFIDAA